jgi:hypothetical protein
MDVWEIFSDTVLNAKTSSGKSVFQVLKDDVVALTKIMGQAMAGDNASKIGQGFMDIYQGLKPLITDVLYPIGQAVVMVGKAFSDLVGGPGNAVKILLGVLFLPVITALGGVIVSVVSLGAALGPVFAAIWTGGSALAGIGVMLGGFGPLISTLVGAAAIGLAMLVIKVKPLQDALSWVFNRLKDIFGFLGKLAMAPINIAIGTAKGLSTPVNTTGGGFKNSKYSPTPRNMPAVQAARSNVVAIQPKQDSLNVHIKMDATGPRMAGVTSKGDSKMNFTADTGRMRA